MMQQKSFKVNEMAFILQRVGMKTRVQQDKFLESFRGSFSNFFENTATMSIFQDFNKF